MKSCNPSTLRKNLRSGAVLLCDVSARLIRSVSHGEAYNSQQYGQVRHTTAPPVYLTLRYGSQAALILAVTQYFDEVMLLVIG